MSRAEDFPASSAAGARTPAALDARLVECRACPRLVAWREETARTKRAAFRDWTYWGRPVPGFGPPDAALVIVGLAPAAHGANRTGRMFTGDQAGELLFSTLYGLGLTSRPTATHRGDGLELYGVRVTAPVHCAPPDNRPTTGERDTCRPWLTGELRLLAPTVRAVVVLGGFGWQAAFPALRQAGWEPPRPRPAFGHGVRAELRPGEGDSRAPLSVFGSYHVSRRNVSTRRLTPAMLHEVLLEAALTAGLPARPDGPLPGPAGPPYSP
ncbi:uracil-DNA glycosylase [Streptomyces sp. NPDC059783]|uniref:uracil-DNA glycosylase n=1 Tax=Streptomyces sp. NPDC059783 TaxID=3346944 RepID=UPI0036577F17